MPIAKRLSSPDSMNGQEAGSGRHAALWGHTPRRFLRVRAFRAHGVPLRALWAPCGAKAMLERVYARSIQPNMLLFLIFWWHVCSKHTPECSEHTFRSPPRTAWSRRLGPRLRVVLGSFAGIPLPARIPIGGDSFLSRGARSPILRQQRQPCGRVRVEFARGFPARRSVQLIPSSRCSACLADPSPSEPAPPARRRGRP